MINTIKRLFCRHDFKLLSEYNRTSDLTEQEEDRYIIYCPKCRKEIDVLRHEYKAHMEKSKIDKEYIRERKRFRYDK